MYAFSHRPGTIILVHDTQNRNSFEIVMNKWNLILLVSDIMLMGVVLFLLFRMRSSTGSYGSGAQGDGKLSLDAELLKVQDAAEKLEAKSLEMDSLGLALKDKQDHLESVISKVEAVIDTMAEPSVAGAELASLSSAEPSRGETIAMAKAMLSQGSSIDDITAKLKLYRGEVELLTSLQKLSSE